MKTKQYCKQYAIVKKLGLASLTLISSICLTSTLYSSSVFAEFKPMLKTNEVQQQSQYANFYKTYHKLNKYVSDDSSSDSSDVDDPSLPSNDYKVGFHVIQTTDPSRQDDVNGDGTTIADRQILIKIWYPVDKYVNGGTPAEYDGGLLDSDYISGSKITLTSPILIGDSAYDNRVALMGGLPVAKGKFPLILATGGSSYPPDLTLSPYYEVLASHGFIVASVQNDVADMLRCRVVGFPSGPNQAEDCREGDFFTRLERRALDMDFALELLLSKNSTKHDLFHKTINKRKIGFFGFSLGGSSVSWLQDLTNQNEFPKLKAILGLGDLLPFTPMELLSSIESPYIGINGGPLDFFSTDEINFPNPGPGDVGYQLIGTPLAKRMLVEIQSGRNDSFAPCNWFDFVDAIDGALVQTTPFGIGDLLAEEDFVCNLAPGQVTNSAQIRLATNYIVSFAKKHLTNNRNFNCYLSQGYAEDNQYPLRYWLNDDNVLIGEPGVVNFGDGDCDDSNSDDSSS